MKHRFLLKLVLLWSFFFPVSAFGEDFFQIQNVEILKDPTHNLSFSDIQKSADFEKQKPDFNFNLGYQSDTVWVKVKRPKEFSNKTELFLEISLPGMDGTVRKI